MEIVESETPRLFGIKESNRDFSISETWGKNQFNSSFPAALTCYLASKDIDPLYLHMAGGEFKVGTLKVENIFGDKYDSPNLYFSFETAYSPFQPYVVGSLPRTDLVTMNRSSGSCLAGLEIKLTALPDNTTCGLSDDGYGCEIVVRPDTIVYLACSIIHSLQSDLSDNLPNIEIDNWTDPEEVLSHRSEIISNLEKISSLMDACQSPFLLQTVWKTLGKSPALADNCLDVFVWSDAGMLKFIADLANTDNRSITRHFRTVVWIYKMLLDYKTLNKFNYEQITDGLTYNLRNDKAFATSGMMTNAYMKCARLLEPVIKKSCIKEIILGGGQNLLSPERRFDAIIFNSSDLF